MEKYKGIIPAFYACYDQNGEISEEGVQQLTKLFIKKGVKGLYIGGSSGECIYQSVKERKIVLENVVKVAKSKLTIIAHVACNNTQDGIELAQHAESLGVDAIAAIPPIYFKLPEYAIAKYWNDISKAAPNTDFIIYNIPQLAGVSLSEKLLSDMMKNPKVIGVKNSSMPVLDIQLFKLCMGKNKIVFNGPDEQFIGGYAMGAEGGIGGTYGVMPELYLKLEELFKKGNMKKAVELQDVVTKIIIALCSCKGHMYAAIKEVIKQREGIDCGSVRSPLYHLVPEDELQVSKCKDMIDEAIKKYI